MDITRTKIWNFVSNLVTTDLSRSELKDKLSGYNNPDMVSFISLVPEDMNQYLDYWIYDEDGKKRKNPNPTRNPYYDNGILKLSRKYKIVTGFDYEKSIENRLIKEGKDPESFVGGYKPTPLFNKDGSPMLDENGNQMMKKREVWFKPISKCLVTDRKTESKFYFRYQYKEGESTIGTPESFHNGDVIEKEMYESFLTKKDYDNQYSNQGLDDYLPFQVCDLNNILYISIGGNHYRLVGRV